MEYKITRINDSMVALTDDHNLTPIALKHGTICLEHSIANLPEVKSLTREDLVIDVGAFIGDTAIIFAQSECEVIAFEPQNDAFFCMEYNTKNYPNIRVFNQSVGNGETVVLNQDSLNGNLGTRTISVSEQGKKSITIDELGLAKLSLIKIDCEGYEPYVIMGAADTIKKFSPIIVCEIYPDMLAKFGFTKADIYEPLIKMGYVINTSIGEEDSVRWDITAKRNLITT